MVTRTARLVNGTDPRFVNLTGAAQILGVSRLTVKHAIEHGELPALRLRGQILIPTASLEARYEGRAESTPELSVA